MLQVTDHQVPNFSSEDTTNPDTALHLLLEQNLQEDFPSPSNSPAAPPSAQPHTDAAALDHTLLDQVAFSSLFADDDDDAAADLFKLDGTMTLPTTQPATTAASEAGLAAATEVHTFHDALFGGFAATTATAAATAEAAALQQQRRQHVQQQQQQQQQQQRQHVQQQQQQQQQSVLVALVAEVEELGPGPDQLTPHWDGNIPNDFWSLPEEHIALISYKDLAKLMAKSKLTAKQVGDAKKLRRRVKNRQSARVCSTRKRVKCHSTASTNAELHAQLTLLHQQNQVILTQHTLLQDQLVALQKSEQSAVTEKLAMEADVARMQKLLEDTIAGSGGGGDALLLGLPDSLFAIAA